MTQFRQVRAPRINLRGSVSVIVQLENRRQFAAKLHQLSITGGMLELTNYVNERTKLSVAFQIESGLLQAKAETFFPLRGGTGFMQPFRFTFFAPGTRQTLQREINSRLPQTAGPSRALGTHPPSSMLDSL